MKEDVKKKFSLLPSRKAVWLCIQPCRFSLEGVLELKSRAKFCLVVSFLDRALVGCPTVYETVQTPKTAICQRGINDLAAAFAPFFRA
jgi:hypothetical protein